MSRAPGNLREPSTTPVMLAGFAAGVGVLQTRAELPAAPWAWLALAGALLAVVAALRARVRRAPSAPDARTGHAALPGLAAVALAAALAGYGYAAWRADVRMADALPASWEGEDIAIVGIVDDLPDTSDRGVRFAFAVERVETPGAHVPARLSLSWPASRPGDDGPANEVPELSAAERWRLVVRLKRPHGYANPGGFDLEAWLVERNLRATGYVRDAAANRRIDAFAGRLRDHVQRARERVRARIAAALAGEPYAGVVAALAIGDQRAIPDTQWIVFNRTGVGHLVSISGLHVTALAALAAWALARLARRSTRVTARLPARSAGAIGGVAVAGVYTLLAGAEVPALRTFAMLAAGATGLVAARHGTSSILWLWALAAVLALDPWAAGFWLSYGAVAVLIYAAAGRVADVRPPAWTARLASAWREGARTQWAVTVGLVPFALALFGQVSVVSPLANAIAIPVVTLAVVPLAVAGIVVPFDLCFVAAHAIVVPLMRTLAWLAEAPASAWAQHTPLPWTLAAAAIGVAWLLAPRGVPGRPLGAIWLAPLALVTPAPPPEGVARITVLDVGQGLAVVVRTRHHALVYDTGPRWHDSADAGSRIVAPYLRHAGIVRVDTLVVSHQDLDHAGGAPSVLRAVPVARVLSSLPHDHPLADGPGTAAFERCADGMRWRWDGVDFDVLHPTPAAYADPRARTNDLSCVVRIAAGEARVLLAGDIEARSESRLLHERRDVLAADALVVPHHGSRTSSTPRFVAAVDPAIAIFTPGYRNRFGHPRPEVVARYVARGAATLRTDRDGAIAFDAGPSRIAGVERARAVAARYWRDPPRPESEPLLDLPSCRDRRFEPPRSSSWARCWPSAPSRGTASRPRPSCGCRSRSRRRSRSAPPPRHGARRWRRPRRGASTRSFIRAPRSRSAIRDASSSHCVTAPRIWPWAPRSRGPRNCPRSRSSRCRGSRRRQPTSSRSSNPWKSRASSCVARTHPASCCSRPRRSAIESSPRSTGRFARRPISRGSGCGRPAGRSWSTRSSRSARVPRRWVSCRRRRRSRPAASTVRTARRRASWPRAFPRAATGTCSIGERSATRCCSRCAVRSGTVGPTRSAGRRSRPRARSPSRPTPRRARTPRGTRW